MDLLVTPDGCAQWGEARLRCAIGAGGVRTDKREGDMATPSGAFPLRCVLFRGDRVTLPGLAVPVLPLGKIDGWCDSPGDPAYNRMVRLPYPASAERLWRDDQVYDVIGVLGHNDAPPLPGRGSAIFLHVATADFAPTAGCVALPINDLITVLREADVTTCVRVSRAP